MIDYYEYETSPRKIEPEYEKTTRKKTNTQKRNKKAKSKSVDYSRKTAKYIVEIAFS